MNVNTCNRLIASPTFVSMKSKWLLYISIIGIGAFFFSAMSMLADSGQSKRFSQQEIILAMRQIGHELLQHAGDSVSRVLPVKSLEDNSFQLEFQSPFAFVPDSLVKIVTTSLSAIGMDQEYIVNVLDCENKEVIYGFQIGLQKNKTLVPCLGREQVIACYAVRISFLQGVNAKQYWAYYSMFAVIGLLIAFVGGRTLFKKQKTQLVAQTEGGVKIGTYEFWADRRILKYENKLTELSDKETKLLTLFSRKINQPIPREQLMKEVWEDEGVIVGRSLDVFVSKLRKKLKEDSSVNLVSIHGVGYALEVH